MCLDESQLRGTAGTLSRVGGDQGSEIELRERNGADRCLSSDFYGWILDQDGGVQNHPGHWFDHGSRSLMSNSRMSSAKFSSTGSLASSSRTELSTQALFRTGPSSATGRPETVIVKFSPASARRRISPTSLRSFFCGISGT